jgi:hypothetical protein
MSIDAEVTTATFAIYKQSLANYKLSEEYEQQLIDLIEAKQLFRVAFHSLVSQQAVVQGLGDFLLVDVCPDKHDFLTPITPLLRHEVFVPDPFVFLGIVFEVVFHFRWGQGRPPLAGRCDPKVLSGVAPVHGRIVAPLIAPLGLPRRRCQPAEPLAPQDSEKGGLPPGRFGIVLGGGRLKVFQALQVFLDGDRPGVEKAHEIPRFEGSVGPVHKVDDAEVFSVRFREGM